MIGGWQDASEMPPYSGQSKGTHPLGALIDEFFTDFERALMLDVSTKMPTSVESVVQISVVG